MVTKNSEDVSRWRRYLGEDRRTVEEVDGTFAEALESGSED